LNKANHSFLFFFVFIINEGLAFRSKGSVKFTDIVSKKLTFFHLQFDEHSSLRTVFVML